ncbi:MAG: MATE family efflux transporter [Chloroflexi bacterium]|nr:MATE family efflux transporter [Chloroflexota bacterium]
MAGGSKVERLGTEKISRLLWEMSSQTTLSLLVYAIYSVTDTYFLSVGINSLAAAGASIISPVLIALGGVATTVGAGGASVVSRALGANNPEKASRTVANTFLIFWAVAITISVFGALFIEPIVYLFGATESVAPYAIEYGRIIFLGAIFSTGFSTIVRADGSIRYSTAMWIIPVAANTFLAWLFVMVLHMGVSGAALATVIGGQALSAGMSMYFFFFKKNRTYQIKLSYFKPDWATIGEVILIGFPSFIKSFSASLLVIITNNLLKAIGGDSALSIFAITSRLFSSLNTPQTGIMQGMQPVLGYNFGKMYYDRVRKTIAYSLSSSVIYGLFICCLCLLFPAALIGLLSNEPQIITEGQSALRLMALACPLSGISMMVAAYFQSAGRAMEAFVITLGGILLVKLPVLLLSASLLSLTGIWISEAVSETILCIIALLMLRSHQEKLVELESSRAAA